MPILRKRRVSRGLAAEEGQGVKSWMHRKQGSGAQFSGQSRIQQRSRGYQVFGVKLIHQKKSVIFGLILQEIVCRCLSSWNQEIFATKAQRFQGFFCYSFIVFWCLCGEKKKVL
jgi:hypothetical protein